ncbi:MoaD/ThiS family protein [Nitrospira defluvii]|nr:MoaD/ThiS family protein [Nitrospira defluvii]
MVNLKFFAVLKHLVGKDQLLIDVEKGSSLEKLLEKLINDFPTLKEGLQEGKILVSVNQEVVEKSYLIQDDDEIAFLPPFAGG